MTYKAINNLRVASCLHDLVNREIAPGTGIEPDRFWNGLNEIVVALGAKNRQLLEQRDSLQKEIDAWYRDNRLRNHTPTPPETRKHLESIGYLLPEKDPFHAETSDVDPEITLQAGPQLVVPIDNARYALNAANARWGSLFDALYGTDLIPESPGLEKGDSYNPKRGEKVFEEAHRILDRFVPLSRCSYADVRKFMLHSEGDSKILIACMNNGKERGLSNSMQFAGYTENGDGNLTGILLRHNHLHIEIQIDPEHPVGRAHPAGINDVVLEAALTTIQDFEDSVATVDAADKVIAYRNWTGLMKGTLETTFEKNGKSLTRRLNPDKTFTSPDCKPLTLPGRSLLLARNVGLHLYTDSVTDASGDPIPEGILDTMVTVLAGIHDLKKNGKFSNSKSGSIYIVKPKMHGPGEIAFTVELFSMVESVLGLAPNTIKIGIMDEERRTTVNLRECIRVAKNRIVFINTGFLDRTADEIHTAMEAGPVIPKMDIKNARWMLAYEDWNVDIGIETGLPGKAQIGKGMWTMPDEMKAMMDTKADHPRSGANTAWVPSPTAATLHAIHYHEVNVPGRLKELAKRKRAGLHELLIPPLLEDRTLTREEIRRELENNAQGILGYVVRWIDQGIGCSKVPDIRNVGLMEDRATLRISSQHVANWLHHGIVTEKQVIEVFQQMAGVVDQQNAHDPNYENMAHDYDHSIAFQAALDLVFKGREEPGGYTERILFQRRRQKKTMQAIPLNTSSRAN